MRRSIAVRVILAAAGLSSPAMAQDPWSRVPPLPTSCYDGAAPGFVARLQTIRHEIVVESDKISEANGVVLERFNNMDMSEKQSKMMAYMTKNPMEAGKVMQEIAAAGERSAQHAEQLGRRTAALTDQLERAESQYKTDQAPLIAIHKRYQEAADPSGSPTLASQLAGQYNAEYERMCAKWFRGEASPLLKYLGDIKTYVTTEKLVAAQERDRMEKQQFEIYGFTGGSTRSTANHGAAVEYIDAMIKVYGGLRGAALKFP